MDATALHSKLQQENQALLAENAEVKAKYVQMQGIAQATQQSVQGLIVEKGQLLQRLQRFKLVLEEKENEMQQLKRKYQKAPETQHLESQLREEVEMKMRLHKELQENEKFRDKYNELRREFALVKNDYEHKIGNQEKIAEVNTIEAEDRIRGLEHVIADLEGRLDDRSQAKVVKLLQSEKMGLEDRVKALTQELEVQRVSGEQASVSLIDVERKYTSRAMEAEKQCRTLLGEAQLTKEKMKALEGEKQTLQLEVDRLHAEKLKLQGDGAQLRQQMEVVLQSFKTEKAAIRQAGKEREQQWDSEKSALELRIVDLNKRVADTEAVYAEVQRQKDEADRAAKAKLSDLKEDIESRNRILERETTDLKMEREAAERQNERVVAGLRRQIESLRRDVTQLRSEKDEEAAQRSSLELKFASLEQQSTFLVAERDDATRVLEETRERLDECKHELQTALDFRSENDHLRLQLEFVQRDNRDLEAEREDMKEEFAKRIARMQKVYQDETQTLQQKTTLYKAQLEKKTSTMEKKKAKFAAQVILSERRAQDCKRLAHEKDKEIQQLKRQMEMLCTTSQDELPGGLDRHAAHASPTGGSARVQTAPLGPFHELENEPLDCLFGPPDRLFDSLTRF